MMKIKTVLNITIVALLFFAITACKDSKGKFDAMGTFESDEILISLEVGGKILSLNITQGDNVSKGAEIGKIDSKEFELNRDKLMKKIDSLNIQKSDIVKQLAPLKEQLKTAESEKERIVRLLKVNAANQKNLDDINASINLYRRQIAAQESNLSSGNSAMDQEINGIVLDIDILNDKIGKSIIKSNIDGIILEKYAYEGEVTSAGRPILKVADVSHLKLKAYINQKQLSQIKIGDTVKVFVDHDKGYKEYEGRLIWISASAEFTPKTIQTKDERQNLVYAVKISVVNDGYIKIGSYGEVTFANILRD